MTSVLRKEISTVWLVPLSLMGLPFLLAAAGRLLRALGADSAGESLVELARAYGNLPLVLLGFSSPEIANSILAFVLAGVLYSGIIFLLVVCGGFVSRQLKRSRSVV